MKRITALIALALAAAVSAFGQRTETSLEEGWFIRPITANKNPELTPVTIPHTWNAEYLPDGTYNREMMVYTRSLEVTPAMAGKRLFLYFEGVNSVCDVFVNKRTVGGHKGGYTAFCIEITDAVRQGVNELEVWVSNAYRTDVLPISGDFNIYGGIHRPCHLLVTEADCISPLFHASPGVFIRQNEVNDAAADITVETVLSLKDTQGLTLHTVISDASGKEVASASTRADGEWVKQPFNLRNPILWNGRENPYLYTVTVQLMRDGRVLDEVVQQTGFRYFRVDADKGFFLNGKPLDLHGFCRHEDFDGRGSALLPEDYDTDFDLIMESGATMLRLAHYPHAEPVYRHSDEKGIILWTEIPMCGPGGYDYTGYLGNAGFRENAIQDTYELVYQKFNHPSVCFWGIFNEILVSDGSRFVEYDDPIPFISEINDLYHKIDPSRLTTFATCVDENYYLGISDLIAWNKYFGWYGNEANGIGPFMDQAKADAKGQPVGISEYGAGASIHHHWMPGESRPEPRGRFHGEERQALVHESNLEAFQSRPYLWSKIIWVFSDFHSSIRKEGDRDGFNDKGLVTYDRKTRKDAFFLYKANWTTDPMVYITSRRYTERTQALTDIKVYSNMDEVTLFLNGKKLGKVKPDNLKRAIWKGVSLQPGENTVTAEGRSRKTKKTDTCTWTLNQ